MNNFTRWLYLFNGWLIFFVIMLLPNLSSAQGTVWEDLHLFTVKQCPALADTMSIEDFDQFASKIYTPLPATRPRKDSSNFNEETAKWLCAIKHHQSQQNYLTMISAQELNTKPLSLPLLQLDQNILTAANCLILPHKQEKKKENCLLNLQKKQVTHVITITQSQQFQIQDEKSLKSANIYVLFRQSKQYLEKITLLLLKEAELRQMNINIDEINQIRKQSLTFLHKVVELQNRIDEGLDKYKHKLDVEK